jgi:predicted nucleotidyltransferase
MTQQLARADVESALRDVGDILARQNKIAEIAIYGGSAILLQYDVQFRTGDVDIQVEGGDHGALQDAIHEVARRRGWLKSWMSEAVTMYLGEPGGREFHGSYPSEDRVGLRVYVARPDYILAMKLRAMRTTSRDFADARLLALDTGITDLASLLALVHRYFPNETMDLRRHAIIASFVEAIHAPPAD